MSDLSTRELILKVAKDEFLAKGFRDASLRNISSEVGVAVSNIYNHFKNKDDLFRELVRPLLELWDSYMESHFSSEEAELFADTDYEKYKQLMQKSLIFLVKEYPQELKLLLLYSSGSSLEYFMEEYIDKMCMRSFKWFQDFKEKYPDANIDISPFMIRFQSSLLPSLLKNILIDNSLTEADLMKIFDEYVLFTMAGWKSLMAIR